MKTWYQIIVEFLSLRTGLVTQVGVWVIRIYMNYIINVLKYTSSAAVVDIHKLNTQVKLELVSHFRCTIQVEVISVCSKIHFKQKRTNSLY